MQILGFILCFSKGEHEGWSLQISWQVVRWALLSVLIMFRLLNMLELDICLKVEYITIIMLWLMSGRFDICTWIWHFTMYVMFTLNSKALPWGNQLDQTTFLYPLWSTLFSRLDHVTMITFLCRISTLHVCKVIIWILLRILVSKEPYYLQLLVPNITWVEIPHLNNRGRWL